MRRGNGIIRLLFRSKFRSYMAFRPGEGPRALRFHDLSRRAARVVGRSDAVLHRFGEAKPSRNGCIVVRPLPLRRGADLQNAERTEFRGVFYFA